MDSQRLDWQRPNGATSGDKPHLLPGRAKRLERDAVKRAPLGRKIARPNNDLGQNAIQSDRVLP
jgi:hypothetical protein